MQINILGPIEVISGSGALQIPRRQGKLALGILALQANQVVSADRLIDLLWGEDPPASARAILQSRLSELRGPLAGVDSDRSVDLRAVSGGYRLSIDPDAVDAHRFRTLVAAAGSEGKPDNAVEKLRIALGLWRGPALGGWLAGNAHLATCHWLDASRLSAYELLFEMELVLGHHQPVDEEILPLVAENPGRERLTELLMIAQHRSGRTADALHSYQRCRRWLADELGIDPRPGLRDLHLALLRGAEPVLSSSTSVPLTDAHEAADEADREQVVPNTLPGDARDFVGRETVTMKLVEMLVRREAAVPTVVVTGPAGVGKTALSVHVAHLVRHHFPDGQLFADLHGADWHNPPTAFELLARFLQALGVEGTLPDSLDGRVDLYRQLLSERRVMIVLDNASGMEQVQPLIPGSTTCAVLVNSRTRIGAYLGADILELPVLSEPQAVKLLARIAGLDRVRSEPEAAVRLTELCGGLPLAIRVAAARLATKPHWSMGHLVTRLSDERRRLDQLIYENISVRSSIGFSYADLGPDAQRLLRLLGDINYPDVAVWSAAALLDTSLTEAEGVLEQLYDARLVEAASVEPHSYIRYRLHDLVRIFAAERARDDEDPAVLAAARDRCFGAWLSWLEEIERRVIGGRLMNLRSSARRWPVVAGDLDMPTGDPLQWFDAERLQIIHVIRRAAEAGRSAQSWGLAVASAPLFETHGYYDEMSVALEIAHNCTIETRDDLGRAAVTVGLGVLAWDLGAPEEARDRFGEARRLFDALGETFGSASATAHVAFVDRLSGRHTDALAGFRTALPAFQRAGDAVAQVFVNRNIGLVLMELGDLDAAQTHIDQAMAIARAGRLARATAQVRLSVGQLCLRRQRYAEAEQLMVRCLADARALRDRGGELMVLFWLAQCYKALGRVDAAYRTLHQALSLATHRRPTTMEVRIREELSLLPEAGQEEHPGADGTPL